MDVECKGEGLSAAASPYYEQALLLVATHLRPAPKPWVNLLLQIPKVLG